MNVKNNKIIYLCSGKHIIDNDNFNITYNDIIRLHNNMLICDALSVDLADYDVLIATPPCNYYSRANYRRDVSDYALKTKHLLPDILNKFISTGKPFLIENVRNHSLFNKNGLFSLNNVYIYEIGRHTYWSNYDFLSGVDWPYKPCNTQKITPSMRQGDDEVHFVIEMFLKKVEALK